MIHGYVKMWTLGIDPGLSGALVAYDMKDESLEILRMPVKKSRLTKGARVVLDPEPLASWLDFHAHQFSFAYIEKVGSRPLQQGQFLFGLNTGMLHGMLYANMIPFKEILPRAWKDSFELCKSSDEQTKRDLKTLAREKAKSIFPKYTQEFSRVKDDGVAEAALLAYLAAQRPEETEKKGLTTHDKDRTDTDGQRKNLW